MNTVQLSAPDYCSNSERSAELAAIQKSHPRNQAVSPCPSSFHKQIHPFQLSSTAKLPVKIVGQMSGLDPVNDKSHHNPSGGFTNPWPSFRNETLWAALLYIRKNWNKEAAKVPPQSELFVKVLQERQMAWERIRNPPKDQIQATW